MPETSEVREKIKLWMKENNVSYPQLGLIIGRHHQVVYDAISGRNKSTEANQILLKIIQMFGIK